MDKRLVNKVVQDALELVEKGKSNAVATRIANQTKDKAPSTSTKNDRDGTNAALKSPPSTSRGKSPNNDFFE
jgi:hypothetical protein